MIFSLSAGPSRTSDVSAAATGKQIRPGSSRSSVVRALASLSIIAATLLGFSGAASAQTAETCITVEFGGAIDPIGHNLLDPVFPVTPTIPIDLPAGEVNIPEAISTDSYPARVDVRQTSEIWVVEFIGADGSVVGTSAQTTDVPDLVASGEWIGPLGTVTLTAPAVGVRAAHRPDVTADRSPNSVNASEVTVCTAAAEAEAEACPTNADGTPVDPTDPDCPQPEACPTNADGTPVDPTDPDCNDADAPLNPNAPAQTPDADPTSEPTLPVTGAETSVFVFGGLWLLAAGATLIMFGNSRKSVLR